MPTGPDSTMGCRIPYWVALCLLGAVSMDPGVIQTPKHLVTGTTRSVTLKCEQHLGHKAMYWYKQSVQKPPELMLAYNYKDLFENATASSRFLPDRPDNSQLDLQIKALEPEDSALYLCASSEDTPCTFNFSLCTNLLGLNQEAVGATNAQLNISWRTPY